jgi:hypothetical protein
MQPKHMDILLVTLLISEVQSSPCLLKANFSPSAHSKSPNAKAMAIRTPQTYHMKYSLQSQKNCPRWKCEAKLLKIDQDILVIIWPDFIYLAIWILLDHYMHYVVLHFFNVTMNCRYSDIPIDDVRKVCPACRGICNCRVCLLGDNVIKARVQEISAVDKLEYLHSILASVLPVLKQIYSDQCFEIGVDTKAYGIPVPLLTFFSVIFIRIISYF